MLAVNNFQYEPDVSILTRVEVNVMPSPLDLPGYYRPQAETALMIIRELMDRPDISDKMELNFLERSTVQKLLSEVNREHNSHCDAEWYGN